MQERNPAQAVADEPRAFDETQLARRWDISVRTLQQWRWMGIGPIERMQARRRTMATSERRDCHAFGKEKPGERRASFARQRLRLMPKSPTSPGGTTARRPPKARRPGRSW
jgi:hypothetical protein